MDGGLEDEDVIDPGDGRDGSPVGAYSGVWILVSEGATGVLPTRPVGPFVQGRMCATFVGVQPAGVQVAQQDGLVIWLPLVFVRFAHDEVLDECERVVLFHVRRVAEWAVLLEVLDNVGME